MAHVTASRIKHDGKVTNEGEKVSKKDFGDSWDQLVEAGAIVEEGSSTETEPTPVNTKAEQEEGK